MTLNQAVHKNLMFQILKDIYSDLSIAPFLGFKGGTAAFMFYELGRFSVLKTDTLFLLRIMIENEK